MYFTSKRNWNTAVLLFLSVMAGLATYGFLGMYPTFLREYLHYSPADAGKIVSFYGFGALMSVTAVVGRPASRRAWCWDAAYQEHSSGS